jgi:hypothetical protein
MMSFQDSYEFTQSLVSDSDATNLTLLKSLYNIGRRKLEKGLGTYYTEKTRTITTVTDAISGTSNKDYRIPENFGNLTMLYVTSGGNRYYAELIQDEELWQQMLSGRLSSTSNYLSHCFIRQDRVEFFPIPSSALTATMIYRAVTKDLSKGDYVTGTITTLANAGTAVTASGSTFTSAMVGRYFKIDDDNEWYRIGAFGTTTTLTLEQKYQGTAIAAGTSAYTIGEFANLPPDCFELPCYYAAWKFALFRKDRFLAHEYRDIWNSGFREATSNWANRSSSNVIKNRYGMRRGAVVNPNLWPENLT